MTTSAFRRCATVLGMFAGMQSGCLSGDSGERTGILEADVALPPPTNLMVTVASATRMDLDWDASPEATKYVVLRGLSSGTETSFTSVSADSTTFTYSELSPNTTYCWQVANVNSNNEASAPSNEVCAVTDSAPTAPAVVTAIASSPSRITISWSPVADATFYSIEMAVAPGTPTFLGTVRAPATSFVAAGLLPSTTYQFAVHTVTAAGTSPASTPLASATTLVGGLEGYWKLDDESGVTALDSSGFSRTGTLSGGAAFTAASKPNVLGNESIVSVPEAGGGGIRVANAPAFNFIGTEFSVALWVNLPAAASTVHIMGQRAADCGAIGWELVQGPDGLAFASGGSVVSFGSALTVGAWTHLAVTFDGATLHALINGVEVSASALTVVAHGALPLELGHVGGCPGGAVWIDEAQIWSRELTAAEVASLGTLPRSPKNLTATALTSTAQELTWTPVSGAEKYIVFRGTAPGDEVFLTTTVTADPTFSSGDLVPSTLYTWQVAAVKGSLFSEMSNEAVATTFAGPAAPASITAVAESPSSIRVGWSAVAGAVVYQVFQSVNGEPFVFLSTTAATSFSAGGLPAATRCSYVVRAVDSGNTISAFSATVSATML